MCVSRVLGLKECDAMGLAPPTGDSESLTIKFRRLCCIEGTVPATGGDWG